MNNTTFKNGLYKCLVNIDSIAANQVKTKEVPEEKNYKKYCNSYPIPVNFTNKEAKPLKGRVKVPVKTENEKTEFFHDDNGTIYVIPSYRENTHPSFKKQDLAFKKYGDIFVEKKDLSDIKNPEGIPCVPVIGKEAKVLMDGRERIAVGMGFDYKERPVVHLKGDPVNKTRIITNEKEAKLLIPQQGEIQSCLHFLKTGKVYHPSEKFCKLVEYCLANAIVGKQNTYDYINWLRKNGLEAMVLGGAIRDVCRAIALNPNLSCEEAIKIINDIDLSVTGGVPTAERMFREVHEDDYKDIQVVSMPQFGGVHAKKGAGNGLDYNTMMRGNRTYDSPIIHPDIPNEGRIVPAIFGADPEGCAMALDFACNTLMYDPINKLILDPTGHGLEDAIDGFLRLTGGEKLLNSPQDTLAFKQPELFQRFWKFRCRDMKSNPYTTMVFQTAASKRWTTVDPVVKYNDIMRMLPTGNLQGSDQNKEKQLEKMLNNLGEKMHEDDTVSKVDAKIFQNFIADDIKQIIYYIINHKKKL